MTLELFTCERLPGRPRLTRASCGGRWTNAKRGVPQFGGKAGHASMGYGACVGCPIGEKHAAGERPDVEVGELRGAVPETRTKEEEMSTKTCAECAKGFEGHHKALYCSDECKAAAGKKRGRPTRKRATKKKAAAQALNRALGNGRGQKPIATPASPDVDGAVELLELAGYQVRAVRTPTALVLVIGGDA